MSKVSTTELEEIKSEIRDRIEGYVLSLKIFGTLKRSLERRHLHVHVEKDLSRLNGTPKCPDLLIEKDNDFLILDNKFIRSTNPKTLESALDEVGEYDDDFTLESVTFRPEVALLCPMDAAGMCEQLTQIKYPIVGYLVEKDISLRKIVGSIRMPIISDLCDPGSHIPIEEEVRRYKFIRQEAPLPYTAQVVFYILDGLFTDYFQRDFEVSYEVILDQFNTLFPRWIRNDVYQLTPGRLNDALGFLRSIGWINWNKESGTIVVDRTKGGRILDIISHFIDRYAVFLLREKKKKLRETKAERIVKARPGAKLENFFQ